MNTLKSCAVITIAFISFSCASIIHGPKQDVAFSSTPTGAKVTIDGLVVGKTPLTSKLTRKSKSHIVKIEMPGYLLYEANFARKTDGWVWGNIVFGGLIGLIVDASNGSMYKLSPEQLHAEMKNGTSSVQNNKDGIIFMVTLKVNPEWQKVGQLTKDSNNSNP